MTDQKTQIEYEFAENKEDAGVTWGHFLRPVSLGLMGLGAGSALMQIGMIALGVATANPLLLIASGMLLISGGNTLALSQQNIESHKEKQKKKLVKTFE